MGSPSDGLIRQLRAFRAKASRRYPIRQMILFGSRAKGRARPDSDVDLIVVSEAFRRKNAIDRAYLMRLEWDLEYAVDFLCYTPEEFSAFAKVPGMIREAMREGKRIPV
ncbi:MAG: nucleotidyltransferase domain-containing protein [Methanobacteriota archaeon]